MIKKTLALTATASLSVASVASAATIAFDANFNGTTVADFGGTIGFGAQITATNLNAGTATGTWTVDQAQAAPTNRNGKMIQTDGGANVTNKALRFGIGIEGTVGANNPILTANLTSTLNLSNTINVSFDQGYISVDGASNRRTYLTGRDGSDNRLFQIFFVNEDSSGSRIGYVNTAGALTLIGANGDLLGNNNFYWDDANMKTVTVDIGPSTFDIKLAGNSLTGGSGIAFRDVAANGLSKIQFSTDNAFTGSAFDNFTVSQIPEPGSFALVGFGALAILARRRRQS